MKLTTLAITLITLTSVKAYATVEPEPEPTPEPPPVVEPVKPTVDGDSDYESYNRIYYAVCTCDEFKVAWGFESLELRTNKARMQCEQRRERINCPMKWK